MDVNYPGGKLWPYHKLHAQYSHKFLFVHCHHFLGCHVGVVYLNYMIYSSYWWDIFCCMIFPQWNIYGSDRIPIDTWSYWIRPNIMRPMIWNGHRDGIYMYHNLELNLIAGRRTDSVKDCLLMVTLDKKSAADICLVSALWDKGSLQKQNKWEN